MGLDRYFDAQRMGMDPLLGHPIVDDTMDLNGPGSMAMRVAFQRWLANQRGRRASRVGLDDDLGADDEEADELGADLADDDEIDDLGAAPYDEDLGGIDDRIQKLKDKRREKVSRKARARSRARKALLTNQIEKIDRKLTRLNDRKQEQSRGRGGRGNAPGRRDNGPGALRASRSNLDLQGRWHGVQPAGRQVKVSALAGGDTMAVGSFAANTAAGSQVAWSFTTAAITYASFRVLGIELTGWVAGDDGTNSYTQQTFPMFGQLNVVAEVVQADGYPNLLYGDNQMPLGGQFGLSSSNVFDGIRDNSLVRRNNTVTVSGYTSNVFATPNTVGLQIDFAVSANLLLDVFEDDVFDPGQGD